MSERTPDTVCEAARLTPLLSQGRAALPVSGEWLGGSRGPLAVGSLDAAAGRVTWAAGNSGGTGGSTELASVRVQTPIAPHVLHPWG